MSFNSTFQRAQSVLRSASSVLALPLTAAPVQQKQLLVSKIMVRGKRTKTNAAQSANVQRLVTQLSVFSARKKQPRRLKLSLEDLLRHNATTRAWALFQKSKRDAHELQLEQQYNKIVEACEELEATDPFLAFEGTRRERGKRFSPELRVPTDTPPTVVWQESWEPAKIKEEEKK